MRRLLSLVVVVSACTASVTLGPPITCSSITLTNTNGECDLVPTQQCSDGNFYEVDCGDDGSCTCSFNGVAGSAVLASDQMAGFCATLTVAMMHDIAAKCADPNHAGDNLNIN